MARVSGKVAIVTGASRGIGKATALMLAREGARVAVADLKEDEGQAVVAEIGAAGGEALFVPLDVSSEDAWTQAMAAVTGRFGRLDIAVNNAGIAFSGTVESTDLAEYSPLL